MGYRCSELLFWGIELKLKGFIGYRNSGLARTELVGLGQDDGPYASMQPIYIKGGPINRKELAKIFALGGTN